VKKTSLVVSLLLILFAGGVVGETDESNYLWCINEDTPQWKKDIYDSYPDKFKYLKGKYGEYFLLSGYELRIFRFEEKNGKRKTFNRLATALEGTGFKSLV